MRPLALLLTVALVSAPAWAHASVRLHLPHKKHVEHAPAPASGPAAPTSDVPDAVWASPSTRR